MNSNKSGIWQTTFAPKIKSVLLTNSSKVIRFFLLKNFIILFISFFFAISETFFEGSKPNCLKFFFFKIF